MLTITTKTMENSMSSPDHNVWVLLFEQTPPLMRWILAILTGGVYLLLQKLYTNHKERVNKLENLIVKTSDRMDTRVTDLHKKMDKLTITILNNRG